MNKNRYKKSQSQHRLLSARSDGRHFLKAVKFGALTVSVARLFHSRIVLGKK